MADLALGGSYIAVIVGFLICGIIYTGRSARSAKVK